MKSAIWRAVAERGRNRSLTRSRASRSAMIARASAASGRLQRALRGSARRWRRTVSHDRALGREHGLRIDRLIGPQHEALEQGGRRRPEVARQRRDSTDVVLRDRRRAERARERRPAARSGPRCATRRNPRRPRQARRTASGRASTGRRRRPPACRDRCPRPRSSASPTTRCLRPRIRRHLLRGERFELDELEPGRLRLQALPAALARRRLELQLEGDPTRGNADRAEMRDETAHPLSHRPARTRRPERDSPFGPGEVK